MAFKMTGTSLYKKVSTRGGSTMMKHKHEPSGALVRPLDHEHTASGHTKPGSGTPKESSVLKSPKDSAGFIHEAKGHMEPAQDVAARGSGATAYYEDLAKKRKESTMMKHTGNHATSGHRPSDHSSHLIRRKSKVAKKKKASKS